MHSHYANFLTQTQPEPAPKRRPPAAVIEWDRRFVVGIAEMDDEHRELFAQMNAVAWAARLGGRPSDLAVLLRGLRSELRRHFEREEAFMDPIAYGRYKLHVNEHERSLTLVDEFLERLLSGGEFTESAFISYVVNIFRNHVSCLDASLGEYLQGRG